MLNSLLNKEFLTKEEVVYLLNLEAKDEIGLLLKKADQVRSVRSGNEVSIYGMLDFSNNCVQNCLYCGLREDNITLPRYRMSPDEIIDAVKQITNMGVNSVVLQSGEDTEYDTDLMAYIIYSIKQKCNVSITLSIGERGFDEYRTWKIAGADGYLMKYETSNPKLYSIYHIKQKLNDRLNHLRFLKTIGYKIGTGNIVGLPMQTVEDIADDILLYKELGLDVAASGPFIPSSHTPYRSKLQADLNIILKTIAVTRLVLSEVNIPSTTALATLNEEGRIKGLQAGANVVMIDFTPSIYREKYQVYANRKCLDENPLNCRSCLQVQIESIGRKISTFPFIES